MPKKVEPCWESAAEQKLHLAPAHEPVFLDDRLSISSINVETVVVFFSKFPLSSRPSGLVQLYICAPQFPLLNSVTGTALAPTSRLA